MFISRFLMLMRDCLLRAKASLDSTIGVLRIKFAALKPYSPPEAPRGWIYINGACCIACGAFLLLGWLAPVQEEPTSSSLGYQICQVWYIPYNLLICIIWFLEATMWLLFDDTEQEEEESCSSSYWYNLAELSLAIFFVCDSLVWLYGSWFLNEELTRSEIIIYSAIDFVIYSFYLGLAIRALLGKEGNTSWKDVGGGASEQKEANSDFKLLT